MAVGWRSRATSRRSWAVALLVASCATSQPIALGEPGDSIEAHRSARWFDKRAAQLGIPTADARARDVALRDDVPPAGAATDEHTRAEAAAIWNTACARCHGVTGRLDGPVARFDPPPRAWGGLGPKMGFLFGGDRMRAGIYKTISEGGPTRNGQPSPMPAWGAFLSREQMWALVRHIEAL